MTDKDLETLKALRSRINQTPKSYIENGVALEECGEALDKAIKLLEARQVDVEDLENKAIEKLSYKEADNEIKTRLAIKYIFHILKSQGILTEKET